METIVVWSRKGGVGKTATVHALGSALQKRKKKVLFIDCDGQGNLTLTMRADEDEKTMFDVFNQEEKLSQVIQETESGHICAANEMLQTLDNDLEADILKKELKKVSSSYDYCVIDTPAALGKVTINCLLAADKIIIPVEADLYSAQGIPRITDTIESLKKSFNTRLQISGFLVTRYSNRTNLNRQNLESLKQIAKAEGTKTFNTPIRECIAIKEAAQMQTDIFSYAPRSNAAIDYDNFVKEFLKK